MTVKSVPRIEEPRWAWHIGLDAQSTALLNDLWRGEEVEPAGWGACSRCSAWISPSPRAMRADIAGRPVYLALSMGEDERGAHEAAEPAAEPTAAAALIAPD